MRMCIKPSFYLLSPLILFLSPLGDSETKTTTTVFPPHFLNPRIQVITLSIIWEIYMCGRIPSSLLQERLAPLLPPSTWLSVAQLSSLNTDTRVKEKSITQGQCLYFKAKKCGWPSLGAVMCLSKLPALSCICISRWRKGDKQQILPQAQNWEDMLHIA